MNILASEIEISREMAILEALPLDASDAHAASYPFPKLALTGKSQTISLSGIQLENEWLRVILLPDLGGRIAQIESKLDGFKFLSFEPLFEIGGQRGVQLTGGIEVAFGEATRPNAVGPVESDFTEDDLGARAILFEAAAGAELAWHLFVTLPPGSASIEVELRVYNRTWETVIASPDLRVPPGSGVLVHREPSAALEFSAHQTETFHFRLLPTRSGSHLREACSAGALSVGSKIIFEPVRQTAGKVEIQLESGETLSAPFAADPFQPFSAAAPGTVAGVAVISDEGIVIARHPQMVEVAARTYAEVIQATSPRDFLRGSLGEKSKLDALRALSAIRLKQEGATESALNQALAFNADDPWLWWLQSRVNPEAEDALPNAHYLSPFEPVLRAQGFLNQNHQVAQPSSLVAPLATNPDALIDVACQLFEIRDYEDLSRWVDECLRHREVPMLRYLLASALFETGKMEVEACEHVRRAAEAPINPPYPWRKLEFWVLQGLSVGFPNDARLTDLLAMMRASRYNPE